MADIHSFDVNHAKEYGMVEAVLLSGFNFWLTHNMANGTNYHDGLWWTYNSIEAYEELYPYLTAAKIRKALAHLEDEGLIVTGNYNRVRFDRTKWYALTEKGWSLFGKTICLNGQLHLSDLANGVCENNEPIPVSNQLQPVEKTVRGRFAPPTRDEVEAYAREKGYDGFPADRFVAYYESKGWIVGRTKMKSWKAAVTNWWLREDKGRQQAQQPKVSQEVLDRIYASHEQTRKEWGL